MRNSSYSLILILLKLYKCYDHALKICMWLRYTPQINFCHFFCNFNLVSLFFLHFHNENEILCAQLLLQFLVNSFKTLQVYWTCLEDVHVSSL